MKTEPKSYQLLVQCRMPKSHLARDGMMAFLIGGGICVFGQLLTAFFVARKVDLALARTLSSLIIIFLTAIFTGLGWFDKIAKVAGAGTLVPITGFANATVAPAIEFKSEGQILGLAVKLFTITGPVILYGTAASVIYGIILYFASLVQ